MDNNDDDDDDDDEFDIGSRLHSIQAQQGCGQDSDKDEESSMGEDISQPTIIVNSSQDLLHRRSPAVDTTVRAAGLIQNVLGTAPVATCTATAYTSTLLLQCTLFPRGNDTTKETTVHHCLPAQHLHL